MVAPMVLLATRLGSWVALAAALAAPAAVGCDDGGPSPAAADAAAARVDGPGPGPDAAAPACSGRPSRAGDLAWTVASGGRDRTAYVHLPLGYDPTRPSPVVLLFHGLTMNARWQADVSDVDAVADLHGFVAVYAEGTSVPQGWNAGDCCAPASTSGVDDVAFVATLLDRLEAELCVDADRVFATGFSNGGFLSHRLGCELSDRIAAIGPVSGVLGVADCAPSRPMPVMHVHGTSDLIVPYAGGGVTGFRGAQASVDAWASRNQCPPGAPAQVLAIGDSRCEQRVGCADGADVVLCTVAGGGHQWPGGDGIPGGGHTSTDLHGTLELWRFFAAHPRP